MRYLHYILFVLVAASFEAAVADTDAPGEIQTVIRSQIDAFRADDAVAAYAFASPQIQAKFRTPEIFLQSVARSYPQVYRPQRLVFLKQRPTDGGVIQNVLVKGPKGALVMAVYVMVQIKGRWRINGCIIQAMAGKDI